MDKLIVQNNKLPTCLFTNPRLEDVLRNIGLIPREALFLGICGDGQPLMHNLIWNAKKPYFIYGPQGWGKTHMLKTVLKAAMMDVYFPARKISPLVLTSNTSEWSDCTDSQVVGIERATVQFVIDTMPAYFSTPRVNEYGLLLVDGWDAIDYDQQLQFCRFRMDNICTLVTSRYRDTGDFIRIYDGNQPGSFVIVEDMKPLPFFVPDL